MEKNFIKAIKIRAKVKAAQTNKAGAVIIDLATPDGQYTKQIICIDCGAPRKVKPQDAWQVKRCVDCQNKKKGVKLKQMVARKNSPTAKHKEKIKRGHAKLDAWVKRTNEEVTAGFRMLEDYRKRVATEPKVRRVWP